MNTPQLDTPRNTAQGRAPLQRRFWTLAALATLTPVIVLSGCNGSDNNGGPGGVLNLPGGNTSATATPTATRTGTPVIQSAPIALSSGQTGTLNVSRVGNNLTGTLVVPASVDGVKPRATTSFTIPAGTYTVTGTFTLPLGFSLTGNFPSPIGSFNLSGQLPTPTSQGNYTLAAAGQTFAVTLPVFTLPTTTPSPSPSPVPSTGGGSGSIRTSGSGAATLTLTLNGSGSGATFTSNFGAFSAGQDNGQNVLSVNLQNTNSQRSFAFTIFKTGTINAGDSFNLTPTTSGNRAFLAYTNAANSSSYFAASGSITITGATTTGFTLSLSNVKVNAVSGATGSLTFPSGSGTGTYQ